jgi:hypothetical protein
VLSPALIENAQSTGKTGVKSRPLVLILRLASAVIAFQFALDALAFRTPWYSDYLEPESFAGSYEATLFDESTRVLRGNERVLVLGDSSIAEGFSAPLANRSTGDRNWFFSSAGTPAATPRAWYYLLRDLDPDATRYNVIALPMTDYIDADGEEPPDVDIEADRYVDLDRLIVRLRLEDVARFPFTYRDPLKKLWALIGTTFKGYVYSRDVQEFLKDPAARLKKVDLFDENSRNWKDIYPGNPGSVTGISYDSATNRFVFPPNFSAAARRSFTDRYQPGRIAVKGIRRAYRERWLGGIIARYRRTRAVIVLFRVPTRPFPLKVQVPQNGVPFVRQQKSNPNVVVLDEDRFLDLESPALFFDSYHLNGEGRLRFTPRLAQAIVDAVTLARGIDR